MRIDDKRTPKRILQWKFIGTRIRGRPRKRWIPDTEEDMQIMGTGESNVKKEQNGRKSLRRLKPTVGCKRRRSVLTCDKVHKFAKISRIQLQILGVRKVI